jgi:hypothetical protein
MYCGREMNNELEALRLVAQEARELVGQYDATGTIDRANIEALRALLWRASIKAGQKVPR